jgi:2'-5' RNA ligase
MRIFVAIDLDTAIRDRIARFIEGVREFAPDARWVHPESLHITLKFIGEQKEETVEAISKVLQAVNGESMNIRFTGYGFFPTVTAARVFWIGVHTGPLLASLAARIDSALCEFNIPQENRPFSPHLTLARGGGVSGSPKWRKGDRPNSKFDTLQRRLAAMSVPDFGEMSVREFFLYRSQLSPSGSKYKKLHGFSLQ